MRVKRLIELLQARDPDAFIAIDLPNSSPEYVDKLIETPACLLHFLVEDRAYADDEEYHLPPMNAVVITASLDATFYATDPNGAMDPDDPMDPESIGDVVEPDFRPELN